MPKYKLTKKTAEKIYWKAFGYDNIKINIYVEPCKSGHIITATDCDDIPVDRVLVRYDSKIFRAGKCVFKGFICNDTEVKNVL
jgi:hypothetical protein